MTVHSRAQDLWRWAAWALVAAWWAGCTPAQYARQADRAAYGVIARSQRAALGDDRAFDVGYRPFGPDGNDDRGAMRVGGKHIPLSPDANAVALSLDDCLHVAVRNSRSYQQRKETLYAAALALASERRGWTWPLYDGSLTAEASHTRVGNDPSSETNAAAAEAAPGLTQRFASGGVLALAATLNFATDFLGADTTPVGSLLEASLTQPLLRGAWRGLAYEELYRLERDFLFAVFDYERFTQSFAVDVFSQYYAVLRQRDELENERQNIQRLRDTVTVTRVLVKAGQASRIEADQAEQNLINARVRYQQNVQSYEDALDGFKVQLGLPIAAQVRLDYPGALRALERAGPLPVPFTAERAVEVAMTTRPDVLTRRAAVRDAARDVQIAADDFLPRVDVVLGLDAAGSGTQKFYRVQFDEHTRGARVEFEYALDQTAHRDAYRNALIALAKARRDYQQFADEEVRLGVRRSYRNLVQSRNTYELQKTNVEIAARRRQLAVVEQRAGRATARDVLEAEDALRTAQNGLTSALVSYTTTRLGFLKDLGMITVGPRGRIHERAEPFRFDRLARRYPYVGAGFRRLGAAADGGR
jgi:outer membrane protein TolC